MYGGRSGIHARKRRMICEILGAVVLIKLLKWHEQYHSQPPDLFVFNDKHHFFAEVKRDRDFLQNCQKKHFRTIESELDCRVRMFYLREKASNL